ncbi:Alpha/Beta hydrolase protein [Mycena amicta]|nr:Alpha/Beta hydrolase protein [Mycena amicta]
MATLAKPYCEDCIKAVKHSGEPVGKTSTIAGVPTYISEPPSSEGPKKVVLFFADVYGPLYLNNQLIQDYFASHGFHVLGIDYFLGDPIYLHADDKEFKWEPWYEQARKQARDCLPKWLEEVRKIHGADAQYCVVGYCFGALYVMELGATEDIAAAAFAHPGALTEDHFMALKCPLFMSCAESDFTFETAARRRAEDILVENKAKYQIQVFSGVTHGFAIKGDLDNPDFRWAKEESARGIIGWFERFTDTPEVPSARI